MTEMTGSGAILTVEVEVLQRSFWTSSAVPLVSVSSQRARADCIEAERRNDQTRESKGTWVHICDWQKV
jgi:hypothetical protein